MRGFSPRGKTRTGRLGEGGDADGEDGDRRRSSVHGCGASEARTREKTARGSSRGRGGGLGSYLSRPRSGGKRSHDAQCVGGGCSGAGRGRLLSRAGKETAPTGGAQASAAGEGGAATVAGRPQKAGLERGWAGADAGPRSAQGGEAELGCGEEMGQRKETGRKQGREGRK